MVMQLLKILFKRLNILHSFSILLGLKLNTVCLVVIYEGKHRHKNKTEVQYNLIDMIHAYV